MKREKKNFTIGEKATMTRTVTEADIVSFAKISGDYNPLHLDESFAQTTSFKGRIAHGMLSVSFISALIGNVLPGPGSIYLSQEVKFLLPVRIGDTIMAEVMIATRDDKKERLTLATTCYNQEGQAVIKGEALVKLNMKKEDDDNAGTK